MGMFDTNAEEVAKEMRNSAKKHLKDLISRAEITLEELGRHKKGAFAIAWASSMSENLLSFTNDIARANGAVLVRATQHTGSGSNKAK